MKYNRNIDSQMLSNSKEKTIHTVMDRIYSTKKQPFFRVNIRLVGAVLSFALVFVFSYSLFLNNPTPPVVGVELTEYSTEKIVETTYLSGNIIAYSVRQANTLSLVPLSMLFLDNGETTEFEQKIDDFNQYFDMLKVFIDDASFQENVVVETLTEGLYKTKISYTVDTKFYEFYLNIENTQLEGILLIDSVEFDVTGELIDTDSLFSLKIKAMNLNDFIEINYQTQTKDELQKQYEIKQSLNGIYLEREVSVEFEDDKVKVKIHEGDDEYKLEQFSRDGSIIYFLEYKINESEGEVYITETLNSFNKTIYSYDISENGIEKDIDKEDPDDHDDEGIEDPEDIEDSEDTVTTEEPDEPEDTESTESPEDTVTMTNIVKSLI